MKQTLLLLVLFTCAASVSSARISAGIAYGIYQSPGAERYAEVWLHFHGQTLQFVDDPQGGQYAEMNVCIRFFKNEARIRNEEFRLRTPIYRDPAQISDFTDARRFALDDGTYTCEVEIYQHGHPGERFLKRFALTVAPFPDPFSIAAIELLDAWKPATDTGVATAKNGFLLFPRIYPVYSDADQTISFYTEIYNIEQTGEKNLEVHYRLSSVFDAGSSVLGQAKRTPLGSGAQQAVIGTLDIGILPPGEYLLIIEVRNKEGDIKSQRIAEITRTGKGGMREARLRSFENRIRQMSHTDVLYALRTIRPLYKSSGPKAYRKLLKSIDTLAQKEFLLAFWLSRDSLHPARTYDIYREDVTYVNQNYATTTKEGFETDRGYVYLAYGPPSYVRTVDDDFGITPFETWEYMNVDNQGHVEFVFINTSMIPGDWDLVHSTAVGEPRNVHWREEIARKNPENRRAPNASRQLEDDPDPRSNLYNRW